MTDVLSAPYLAMICLGSSRGRTQVSSCICHHLQEGPHQPELGMWQVPTHLQGYGVGVVQGEGSLHYRTDVACPAVGAKQGEQPTMRAACQQRINSKNFPLPKAWGCYCITSPLPRLIRSPWNRVGWRRCTLLTLTQNGRLKTFFFHFSPSHPPCICTQCMCVCNFLTI